MDDICDKLTLVEGSTSSWNDGQTTQQYQVRRRRWIQLGDEDSCADNDDDVSLLRWLLARQNVSVGVSATTTMPTDVNVTGTSAPDDVFSEVAEELGHGVVLGLPLAVTVGLVANAFVLTAIASDSSCRVAWRVLRSLVVAVDTVLLALYVIVVELGVHSVVKSLDVLNTVSAVAGLIQFVQPWLLYIVATYIHQLLLDERHDVPPDRVVLCPMHKVLVMLAVGAGYFAIYVPPLRVLLFQTVPSHRELCTVPLLDQWQLSVGRSATEDVFYYVCYDCLYAVVVYLAPILPLCYRERRLIDAVFRRRWTRTSDVALGSWADVVAVTVAVHIVAHCIKSTLLVMKLSEAITVWKYMGRGDVTFRLLNTVANVAVVCRPIVHFPVMAVYDRPLRSASRRVYRRVAAAADQLAITRLLRLSRAKSPLGEREDDQTETRSVVVDVSNGQCPTEIKDRVHV